MNKRSANYLCRALVFYLMLSLFAPAGRFEAAAAGTGDTGTSVAGSVYYLAANGNDQNAGTQSEPFGTITYASGKLRPGDTLIVGPGTYPGYLLINGQGKADPSSPAIEVRGDGTGEAIIQGGERSYAAYILSSRNIHLSDLTFTYANSGTTGVALYMHDSIDVGVNDSVFSDASVGVYVREGTDRFTISNSSFSNIRSDNGAITLYNAKNGQVYNNTMTGNYYGIQLIAQTTAGNTLYNNSLYNNDYDMYVRGDLNGTPTSNRFVNNIFGAAIKEPGTFLDQNTLDYNLYNTQSPTLTRILADSPTLSLAPLQAKNQERHGIIGEAQLANPGAGDFRIQEGERSDRSGHRFLLFHRR
ncbi:NosD domain-containing protein [Cohnella rhizosphaerae]|uniref:Right-handed parallel beta-helix repeat-containing protein n=1 Tax=Cohnella rhizosphaerae TaxID=1457232 RepID=A0A9X4QXI6_9BACL|nr:NosD domain-containing protein [Cohnella rhizosphaerae]MDG0813537.1 right-handed parallel beta-helix repeat-containing protein [Cohnella rhizosphaerae]